MTEQNKIQTSTQGKKVYIENLPLDMTSQRLKELFSNNGQWQVIDAVVMLDESGNSKGYGFVEMLDEKQAAEALRQFQSLQIN
ncbi:MAG: RNA-binding protein [Candidatus Woesebacteria bacterium]|jgi:RNA recognition motif-containing protein